MGIVQVSLIVFLSLLSHSHQRTDANSSTMTPGCYLGLQNTHLLQGPGHKWLALPERTARTVAFISSIPLWSFILNYFLAVISKNLNRLLKFLQRKGGIVGKMSNGSKMGAEEREERDSGELGDRKDWVIRNGRGEQKNRTGLHFWALTNSLHSQPAVVTLDRSVLPSFPGQQAWEKSAIGSLCPAPHSLSRTVTTDTAKNYESFLFISSLISVTLSPPALRPKPLVCNAFKILSGAWTSSSSYLLLY